MADIRDEQGRPIQLTDEYGRPIQLTDEHGVPMHLTGVATTVKPTPEGHTTIGSELHQKTMHDEETAATMGSETHGGTHFAPTPVDYVKLGASAGAGAATMGVVAGDEKATTGTGSGAPVSHTQAHAAATDKKEMERSTSSSSSSSEDDGQGGRRKKKGIMQKIKEKLPGHNNKGKAAAAHGTGTDVSSTTGGPPVAVEQEHEKKGFMDKIKDKLPGYH